MTVKTGYCNNAADTLALEVSLLLRLSSPPVFDMQYVRENREVGPGSSGRMQ